MYQIEASCPHTKLTKKILKVTYDYAQSRYIQMTLKHTLPNKKKNNKQTNFFFISNPKKKNIISDPIESNYKK
jgi:hypothetical protein